MSQSAGHSASSLLHLMESRLFEAALALELFDQARVAARARHQEGADTRMADWERDGLERRQIEAVLRSEWPSDQSPQERREAERSLYDQAARVQRHQKWQAGSIPDQYMHNLPFMHARSFLTALDSIAQTVDQMIGEGWEPVALSEAAARREAKVPNVRAVRNTVAHESERALLRRQGGKSINLQPVENSMISAPGGVLVLNSLNNNRYGCTMADGHYGEVEVSPDSLLATTELVQNVLDAFVWTGPERWSPSS